MSRERSELYEFGDFRLNPGEHSLERLDGRPSAIPEKAFRVLCLLVENRGHLMTKRELIERVWPDSFVEENNLDKCIHVLRHTLGERPGEGKYIETVRKHGYRFIADVKQVVYTEPRTLSGRYVFPVEEREISLTGTQDANEVQPMFGNIGQEAVQRLTTMPERPTGASVINSTAVEMPKPNVVAVAAALFVVTAVLIGVLLILLG